MEAAERREFPRLEARLAVDLCTKYIYTTGSVLNVSSNGLFIKTHSPLPEGSELELVTHLDAFEKPLVFNGVVRWVRKMQGSPLPVGMGIQLDASNDTKMKKFFKVLQDLPKAL